MDFLGSCFLFIPSQLRIDMKVPSTSSFPRSFRSIPPEKLSASTQKHCTCRLMGCDRPRYFVIFVIPVLCNIPQHGCKATGAVDLLAAFRWPRRAVASARCRAIGLFEGVAWWVTKRCDVPKTMKSFFAYGKTSLNQWI